MLLRRAWASLLHGTAAGCLFATAGEYGALLTGTGAKLLEGEPPLAISEPEVLAVLEGTLRRPDLGLEGKEYALTALMKLAARFPASASRARAIIEAHTSCSALELQTRSVEFSRLFRYDAIRPQVDIVPGVGMRVLAGVLARSSHPLCSLVFMLA